MKLSTSNTAVAASIGGDYIKFKVFKWLDNTIALDPQHSIEIRDPEDARPFEDHLLKLARDIEGTIPVFVTNAAPVATDGAILPFFKNPKHNGKHDYKTEKYRPKESIPKLLAQAGLPPTRLKVDFSNDTQMNMRFAMRNFANELKPGDLVYHFIAGQGLGGGSAVVSPGYDLQNYFCDEPGHQAMPNVEDNLVVEGETRKNRIDAVTNIKAAADPYCAGGNPKDKTTGPKATIYHLVELAKSNPQRFQQALTLLKTKSGVNFDSSSFEASPLVKKAQAGNVDNRDIEAMTKQGDLFANALMIFTADRIADFMVDIIKKENRITQENPLTMITCSGGWINGLYNCPSAWKQIEFRLKHDFGDGVRLKIIKPEEGFDGTIELAKMSIKPSSDEQEKSKPNIISRLWTWIKSWFDK